MVPLNPSSGLILVQTVHDWSTHRREYHRARLFMAESFQHIDSARLADSDFRSDMFASILSIPFHEYFRLAPPGLRFTQMWAEPIPD
jgi:hypothetical protein